MLFSSMSFIYLFLPIVCVLYFFVRQESKNTVLLIASIIFYAWGEPRYLSVMILTILVNYIGALLINDYRRYSKCALWVTIILNLSFLFYFKYFNFFIDNINLFLQNKISFVNVIMPIGISFYTFQAMSYLIDVYRQEVKVQRDLYKLSLYIVLFPQLVAGPIVKYHDVADQIESRQINFDKVLEGIKRFIVGLSKKMLIANTMGAVADKIFSQPVENFDALTAWIGAIAYSLQLFFDFSGYSDMAIGLGLIFGFRFLENFNYPYISKSITEFWRRWHISLSTWFKEYLYIPLGGNKVSRLRNYFNLFVVFLVTGFWHGASWNFIFWGLWHGMFIIFEKISGWHKDVGGKALIGLKHIYALFVIVIGWVMFRAENMEYACQYLKNMFGLVEKHRLTFDYGYYVGNVEILIFLIAVLCSMPIFKNMFQKGQNKILYALSCVWLMFLFILSSSVVAASTYNPFIYFRF